MRAPRARAAGLFLGAAADAVVGDPRRGHPVAGFGAVAAGLERRIYRDSRGAGVLYTLTCVGAAAGLGGVTSRATRGRISSVAITALATWVVLGGETLSREATAVAAELDGGDLDAARGRLGGLVGRDTDALDAAEVARAVVESVAENTSDAVVAPLFWGAVAGVPGLLAYRAVNTLDAMVGYRSARYARFGWAAARADDVANLVPARLTAALVAALSGRPREVLAITRRYAARHPSPNAGWCEAAFAAALGVRLGGDNRYGGRVEARPLLGDGRPAEPGDIARATALARRVRVAATLIAAACAGGLTARPGAAPRGG